MGGRDDYRRSRRTFLASLVDLERSQGLEIGAYDFATIAPGEGDCEFADYLSLEELRAKASPAKPDLVPLNYVLKPGKPFGNQVEKRFDYILLCHQIQRSPDPIRYLQNMAQLLKPYGVIMLAVPDKRWTPDKIRPSTSASILLDRYFHGARTPSLADVIDGSTAWLEDKRILAEESPQDFFAWAAEYYASGRADVHCNVWEDSEFFEQFAHLAEGKFLTPLELSAQQATQPELAEFYAGFRTVHDAERSVFKPPSPAPSNGQTVDFPFFRELVGGLDHPSILEIGSRDVTGESLRHLLELPEGSYRYVGLDIHDGPNVDLVGDAHDLSHLFLADSIDVVMSKSVMEHIAMPWKLVLELNKILKLGGLVFAQTLFTFPMHELPWDFWRFTDQAWKALFNDSTGFEVVGTEMNIPCTITPEEYHHNWKPENMKGFVNSNFLARKIGAYDHLRLRWDLTADAILKSTYPNPGGAE